MQLSVATCLVLASGIGVSCIAPAPAPTDYARITLDTLGKADKTVKETLFTGIKRHKKASVRPDTFLNALYLRITDSATNFKNRKDKIKKFWQAIAAQLKASKDNQFMAYKAMGIHLDISRSDLLQYLKDDVNLAQHALWYFLKTPGLEATRVSGLFNGDNTLLETVGGKFFFEEIRKAKQIANVPASIFKFINGSSDRIQAFCPYIRGADLAVFTKLQLKEIEPACLAKMGDLATVSDNFAKYVKEMKSNVFASYSHDLHADVLAKITSEQLSKFGSALADPLKRCAKLNLNAVNKTALRKVPGKCVATYLLAKGEGNSDLAKAWEGLPSDLFNELGDELNDRRGDIAKAISDTDKNHMSVALLNQLHKSGKFAKNLVEGGERNSSGTAFELDGKTLAKINDFNIVVRAIQSSDKLSDDLLAYVTADLVNEKFRATIKGKNYEGLQLLDLIQRASNKETIIKNLGSKVSLKEHPCTTLRSFAEFEQLKSVNMLSSECIEALPFSATLDEMKKQPSLIKRYDPSMFNDDDYKTMKASFAKALVRTNFCSAVSEENFKLLSQEALSAIDARCLVVLPFASKLTDAELARLGNDAFALITTDLWKKNDFSFKSLNDKQLGQLSVLVAPEASVFRNLVTPETLKELGGRVKNLTAKQIAALPEATLVTLNLADVAPAALSTLSAAQASALLKVSAAAFTEEHVYQIGAEGSEKAAVLKALNEHSKSFARPAFAALEKRISEAAKDEKAEAEAESSSSGMGTYLIYGGIGLVVVVIAGAAVMFFLRKN